MLPKDVTSIIANYNEPGFFMLNANIQKIYWFNGKRFEFWCKTESWTVFTYENEVYQLLYQSGYNLQKYKNKRFVEFKSPNKWNHPLYLFSRHGYQQTVCRENVYRRSLIRDSNSNLEMFDGHLVHPLSQRGGYFLFSYNESIYTFDNNIFTKFNTITKKWKILNPSPFYGLLYIFNDMCYCFAVYGHDDEYSVFDPKTNQWIIKKINC